MKWADLYLALLVAALVTSALGAALFVPNQTKEAIHDRNTVRHTIDRLP